MNVQSWFCWQLLDSAFPAGGFSHSGGLEAAWRQGVWEEASDGLSAFLSISLRQAAVSWVPLALAVREQADRFAEINRQCHAFLMNHVARQASRQQGRSLLRAASEAFGGEPLAAMDAQIRSGAALGHYAPVFGGVCGALGFDAQRCAELLLFLELRGQLSAAVRLGVVGPMAAQRLQAGLVDEVNAQVKLGLQTQVKEIRQMAPMLELAQMNQDRLYTRLFQS